MTNEEFIKSISLEGEEWRDVVGYEGLYMVSSLGRIISCYKLVVGHKSEYYKKPKLLSPKLNTTGYYDVTISKECVRKTCLLHRLVAIAFIENPNNYKEVDHIDTCKTNNIITNLKWCSSKQNSNNPITINNIRKNNYWRGKTGKLNPFAIPVVRISLNGIIKIYDAAAQVKIDNFTPQEVSYICKYRNRKHKGYDWMYLSDYEKITNKSKNDLSAPTDNT